METPHLLNLGNVRKVKKELSGILDEAALERIEREIQSNVTALLALAQRHYRFAVRQSRPNWRQRVSRLYYAAYNASRAVRLLVTGDYSSNVKDHQKFNKLPNDFPSRDRYVNKLAVLREDRNTCDYDHNSKVRDLVLGTRDSTELVHEFLRDANAYISNKIANP